MTTHSTHTAGRVLAGKYRLQRLLGSGGMGEVWLADHVELGSMIAVKLMSPALLEDKPARARFRREARATARLRSPHVVTVHDFGEDSGIPYLVLEFLEGETLQELAAKRRVDLAEAALFAQQACDGLSLAHAQGIVHRDIKPSNLFIAQVAGQSLLKLVDFGIARAILDDEDAKLTRSGVIVGSPAFMSPEQAAGDPATTASDLWALAAVLYWLVVGRAPFTGRLMSETLYRIRAARFSPPSQLAPELPRELDTFFARAFSLEPERRFQSAEQLSLAFRGALVGDLASDSDAGAILPTRRRARMTQARDRFVLLALISTVLVVLTVALSRRSSLPAAPASVIPSSHEVAHSLAAADTASAEPLAPAASLSAILSAAPTKLLSNTDSARVVRPKPSPPVLTENLRSGKPVEGSDAIDPIFGISAKPRAVPRVDVLVPASRGAAGGQ